MVLWWAVTLYVLAFPAMGEEVTLTFADDSQVSYNIVVAEDAVITTRQAAVELDQFLRQSGGIASDAPAAADAALRLYVGGSPALDAAMPELADKIAAQKLGDDDYAFCARPNALAIVGGSPRGTLNGVYGLLGDRLGCRWYTATVSRIPKAKQFTAPEFQVERPAFQDQRAFYAFEAMADQDWAARNRCNLDWAKLDDVHGGPSVWYGPHYHTYDYWINPNDYFEAHPEYWGLIGGQRNRSAQLCHANPDVAELFASKILKASEEHPEARIFTVCPMDHHLICECDTCKAIDAREGGTGGTVMWFTNEVARRVAEKNPKLLIHNAAYSYYIDPPKTSKMQPNVIIMLCVPSLWYGCGSHAVEKCELLPKYVQQVKVWGEKADRLWIWYYATRFVHYFAPMPNLWSIPVNYRFYRDHHVTGLMMQSSYESPGGELAELRGWLCAQLLWDPNRDVDVLIRDYLDGVYGPAAPPLLKYLQLLQARADDPQVHMTNYASINGYAGVECGDFLTQEMVDEADALLNEAERLAAGDAAILGRVKYMRLGMNYIKFKASQGVVRGIMAEVTPEVKEEMCRQIAEHGITKHREFTGLVEGFLTSLKVEGPFITRWWQLGPLPLTPDELAAAMAAEPPAFDTEKTFNNADGQPLRWERRAESGPKLDFPNKTGRLDKDYMCVVGFVDAPEDMKSTLTLSYVTRGFQAWLNGVQVYEDGAETSWPFLETDMNAVPVELKKGRNELKLWMRKTHREWDAFARFDNPNGILKNVYE